MTTRVAALCLTLLLGACNGMDIAEFAGEKPGFDPARFFTGRTHSWGLFETPSGAPKSRFTTEAFGEPEGDGIRLTQDFTFGDGRRQKRVWHLRKSGEGAIEGEANDVVGSAHGEIRGNALHWQYTLALDPGNGLKTVELDQWMYLMSDGTVINRAAISKLGIVVAGVTEHFTRLP